MSQIASFPYVTVVIRKNGELHDGADVARVSEFVDDNSITDLVVVSHGWNNHTQEAQRLYDKLFASFDAVMKSGVVAGLDNHKIGVLGVFWPSKQFTEMKLKPAGGAASAGGGDALKAQINTLLDELDDALETAEASATIAEVRQAVSALDRESAARTLFADKLRGLLPRDAVTQDDGSDRFFSATPEKLFERLEAPIRFRKPARSSGGAAGGVISTRTGGGGAAGLGDLFRGPLAAARRMLNYTTYYLMKARSGSVGSIGVSRIVSSLRDGGREVRIHLVGHSFGGRVVASAALSLASQAHSRPNSMTLLQAAFSHNGFARHFDGDRNGHFRPVTADKAINGPILVTHTQNDSANATAYPIASRVAGQDASALVGGPEDRFGAIGANGAQHTPEAINGVLLGIGQAGYQFEAGKIYNLQADKYIEDHGDVHGREAAQAILHAIAST